MKGVYSSSRSEGAFGAVRLFLDLIKDGVDHVTKLKGTPAQDTEMLRVYKFFLFFVFNSFEVVEL